MLTPADFSPRQAAAVQLITRLVELESPSTEKAPVDRLVAFLKSELESLGADVTVEPQDTVGDQLIARWNPSAPGELLLLFHMDTVFASGTLAARPVRLADGKFYGPGVLDMKASMVLLLEAVRLLQDRRQFPARAITALFTSDEETGSHHSRHLVEQLARGASLVLCMEPALPGGALKTMRKGTGDIEIIARGRAAHAGVDHQQGVNAIEELAHHILAVQRLTDYAQGTTLSVGKISGGTRTNVVPDEARAKVDVRLPSAAEAERIQRWAAQRLPVLPGAGVSLAFTQNRPPMPRDATMADTFHKVSAIALRLGLALSEGSTGGGSDANFVAPLGVPVIDGLGAVGEGAHSEREYIRLDSLLERSALLAALLTEWEPL